MKTKILFLICGLLLFITNVSFAQGPPDLPLSTQDGPTQAPIDGGLSLLAAAGGAYAIKKLRDKKKNQEDNIDM